MRNLYLRATTAADIDEQVAKLLRGLGNPEPPLRLEEVRTLLTLDRHYYTSTSDGVLRETISRLFVAGKQIVRRPSLLLDVVKKAELKALYIPDRKMILLDETIPKPKHRWNEAHEIIHSVLPWHMHTMLGDNGVTLTLSCNDQIEAEANYGAGRLLFLQDRFVTAVLDSTPSIKVVQTLSKNFGNSVTTTLWRVVEAQQIPAIAIVSDHPCYRLANPSEPCKYFIRSRSFMEQFSNVTEVGIFGKIRSYCSFVKRGPLGAAEIVLRDDNGTDHVFAFETMHNSYDALTLGLYVKERPVII